MTRIRMFRRVGAAGKAGRSGFTLIEMLIVIVILGIAGAMVIPSMGQTGILRVQAGVRTIVSDMTFIQSDAVAFQEPRAIMFDVPNSSYRLLRVPGDALDPFNETMYKPDGPNQQYVVTIDRRFADARIIDVNFDGGTSTALIFDGLGGPVADPGSNVASAGGYVDVQGSGAIYRINVEAFTGRVTVTNISGG